MAIFKKGDRVSLWGTVVDVDSTVSPILFLPDAIGINEFWCMTSRIDSHKPAPTFAVGDTVKFKKHSSNYERFVKVIAIDGDEFWGKQHGGENITYDVSDWEKVD